MKDSFPEFIPALNRSIAIHPFAMYPLNDSTNLFIKLIEEIKDQVKGKKVLDLGTGTGILAIILARLGATVTAVDILPTVVENAIFNLSSGSKEIQERTKVCVSNLYSNLNEKFNFIFFNNPVILAEQSDKDPMSFISCAGKNFEIIKKAIIDLPNFLEVKGSAYFLVSKFDGNTTWSKTHWNEGLIKDSLPQGYSYEITSPWTITNNPMEPSLATFRIFSN